MSVFVGCLVLATLGGCASSTLAPPPAPTTDTAPSRTVQVTGSVFYLERIALTPEAVVQVDVVRGTPGKEDEGERVGGQTLRDAGQVPISFAVELAPEHIHPEASYFIRARITDGERVLSSREPVFVLTQGHPSRDVRVRVSTAGGGRSTSP
ncbi:YbaY family lipoprotein [Cystobacter fuscus]|uniref:YbaY family lipoprotein n=1 Tax=Cystobacter fuscus TaxID=43 RepID=UPI002B309AA8|nr:hypothetical protein F0U63_26890 [Cystobacter fuscus]